MAENAGSIDKLVRSIIGIALIVAGIYFQSWWGVVIGAIAIVTALISWCPACSLLGINSCQKKSSDAPAH